MTRYMKFIFAIGFHCADISGMFFRQYTCGKRIFRIMVINRYRHLRDNWAVIKPCSHKMDSTSRHFYPRLYRLPLCVESAKTGQQGGMDIDNAVFKSLYQIFATDTHISCQTDQIGCVRFRRFQNLLIIISFIPACLHFNDRYRHLPSFCPLKNRRVVMVADNAYDHPLNRSVHGSFMESFRIRSAA